MTNIFTDPDEAIVYHPPVQITKSDSEKLNDLFNLVKRLRQDSLINPVDRDFQERILAVYVEALDIMGS